MTHELGNSWSLCLRVEIWRKKIGQKTLQKYSESTYEISFVKEFCLIFCFLYLHPFFCKLHSAGLKQLLWTEEMKYWRQEAIKITFGPACEHKLSTGKHWCC